MNTFVQWLLLLIAILPTTYILMNQRRFTNKQCNVAFVFTLAIMFFIDTQGTIGVKKSIDTLVNIIMWATIIVMSTYAIVIRDIKKLAMVLSFPLIVLIFRLIDIISYNF